MMMMDHQWAKSLRVDDKSRRGTKNPSFSSTLLDAIYRSIDEGVEGEEELLFYRETMKKKQQSRSTTSSSGSSTTTTATTTTTTTTNGFRGRNSMKIGEDVEDEEEIASLRRACLIEKWMEKKVSEKVVVRRKSDQNHHHNIILHSTSSSSDSSSGGGFSSSEAESVHGSRSRSSSFTSQQRPKPIRTSVSGTNEVSQFQQKSSSKLSSSSNVYDLIRHNDRYSGNNNNNNPQQKQQSKEGGFNRTKSRALKIYGDLKKVKQPISPGGRLANFLNSIFTTGNPKKPKIEEDLISTSERKSSKSAQTSTCSSASSFSRSCLSKTPSSRGKPINGIKRSVRFYPVSVIVDEDSRPCGHKNLYEEERQEQQQQQQQQQQSRLMALEEEMKLRVMEKSRRIEEAARDLLSGYRDQMIKKNRGKCDIEMRDRDLQGDYEDIEEDDDDDDDDTASYSSSDLFELDNLGSIGIERYREELPVYETTHLETNRAIANGLIL